MTDYYSKTDAAVTGAGIVIIVAAIMVAAGVAALVAILLFQ